MTRIILYIAQSIDGYIAGPDGGVGWLDEFNNGQEDYGYKEINLNLLNYWNVDLQEPYYSYKEASLKREND